MVRTHCNDFGLRYHRSFDIWPTDTVSGGDGLVAARHLWHYGYRPMVYYPKPGKNELYQV